MVKKNVVVLFGGQSSEHEISCISAVTIIENLNKDEYEVLIIGITREGHWLKAETVDSIRSGEWRNGKVTALLSPDATHKGILFIEDGKVQMKKVDVVFPVLHGLYGEDGTVQGLLSLSGLPYVGCGVLASAVSMDKLFTKIVADSLHIRQAKYTSVTRQELRDPDVAIEKVESALPYPVFVKPSNAGSSKGVSKAHNREELRAALLLAGEHDRKILVEETITGRELECAVLGGADPRASGVGEILAGADFYDYDAKYNSHESRTVISPELPAGIAEKIRSISLQIFKGVDGFGMARVDLFLEKDTDEIVFNEINTIPGFTSISMYPMLWEAKGLSTAQLTGKLIQSAFAR